MDNVLQNFGQQVKKFRDLKGWSQEELAFRSGFHRTYIGRIERGERNLSLKNVQQIASALELSLADIFNGL